MQTIQPGLSHEITRTVTAEMTPPHLRPTVVLSTPKMIELMETVCLEAAQAQLDEDRTTVGVHVDVSHTSAAREGEEVTFSCHLTEVEGRRLVFEVSATVGERIVGRGLHQRFIVDRSRFGG